METAGKPVVDLSNANPTRAGIALPDPFEKGEWSSDPYSPLASGALATREAVSRYYAEEFLVSIDPNRVLLTTSSSEAYSYCFKLIADPGTSILIPEPSYPLLQFLVHAEGLAARTYPLHFAGGEWILDRDRLAASCDSSTRAVVVVHPNNPTGHYLNSEDLAWLLEFSRNRCWLIADEVFASYNWKPHPEQVPSLSQLDGGNVFLLSGLSKVCALPQMKLGWIVMPPDPEIHRNLEWVADTYLSVSSPIQFAATKWLARRELFQRPVRERCLKNLELLGLQTAATKWDLLPVEAGWMGILRGPGNLSEEKLVLDLLERGFAVHPGFYYDLPFPCSLVVSLLTPGLQLEEGLRSITAF